MSHSWAPPEPDGDVRTRRIARWLAVYSAGVVLILAGCVLPWTTSTSLPWAWDLSAFWAVTGATAVLGLPPSVGAVILAAGLLAAWPIIAHRGGPGPATAGLAGLVIVLAALVAFQSRSLQEPASPAVGLVLAVLGGGLVAAGSVMQDEGAPRAVAAPEAQSGGESDNPSAP